MKASHRGYNAVYAEDAPVYEQVCAVSGHAVLEFGAPWCTHCQAAQPAIEGVLANAQWLHIKVYDGKGKPLGRAFRVTVWPTLIVLRDGREVARLERPLSIAQVRELLHRIPA